MRRLAIALLLTAWTHVAAAADVEQAKVFFEAGRVAYEAGDYVTAIRSLEEAYAMVPKPPIAFSLAQAYRKQFVIDADAAKLKRAVELYRSYLDGVRQGGRREDAVQILGELQPQLARIEAEGRVIEPPKPPPAKTQLMVLSQTHGARASIEGETAAPVPVTREVTPGSHKIHVEADGYAPQDLDGAALEGQLVVLKVDLRELPALVRLDAPSGAEVSLDGRPAGTLPLRDPIATGPGRHFLVVTQRGHHPFTRELTLARGQTLRVDAALERTSQRRASYWVIGGAGALTLAGVVTTVLAYGAQSDAQALLTRRGQTSLTPDELGEYDDLRDRRASLVRASEVLYGAAGAALVTGALLYFLDDPRVERTGLVPLARPGTLGAMVQRHF